MAHGFYPLSHANTEVVLAADFNRTGTRLATGSADHRIRVFELNEDETSDDGDSEDEDGGGGQWELIEEWRAHNAEVSDVGTFLFLSCFQLLVADYSLLRAQYSNI